MDAESTDGAALRRLAGGERDGAEWLDEPTARELARILDAAAGPRVLSPEREEDAVAAFRDTLAARRAGEAAPGTTARQPFRLVRRLGAVPSAALAAVVAAALGSGVALAGVGVPLMPVDTGDRPAPGNSVRSTPDTSSTDEVGTPGQPVNRSPTAPPRPTSSPTAPDADRRTPSPSPRPSTSTGGSPSSGLPLPGLTDLPVPTADPTGTDAVGGVGTPVPTGAVGGTDGTTPSTPADVGTQPGDDQGQGDDGREDSGVPTDPLGTATPALTDAATTTVGRLADRSVGGPRDGTVTG